jgi:hypothetical protein
VLLAAFNPVKQIGQTSFESRIPQQWKSILTKSLNSSAWITAKDPASRKVVCKIGL